MYLNLSRSSPEELKLIWIHFLFATFIGVALNFSVVIPLSLFLKDFPSSDLIYIYTISGPVLFLSGFVLSYLQKKFSPSFTFAFILFFSSFLFFVFWILLLKAPGKWLSPLLMVCAAVLQNYLGIIFVSIIFEVFTLQQNKRLFGLIGSGQALGGALAGFTIPFISTHIGINHIILIISIVLALSNIFIRLLKKNLKRTARSSTNTPDLKKISSKKYIFSIFVTNMLLTFCFFFFDLLFNTEVKSHYLNEIKIANFLGITSAISYLLFLIVGFFFFGKILTNFGISISLLIHPIAIGILIIAALPFFGNVSDAVFFPALVGIIMLERVLRISISKQSVLLFFQPLPPGERNWAQVQNRILINPLSTMISGLVLIGIGQTFGINFFSLSISILVILFLTLVFINIIKKDYISVLFRAVSKTQIVNPDFTHLTKEILSLSKNYLNSEFPEKVLLVLNISEETDLKQFFQYVIQSLSHPIPEVRSYCLNKISQYQIREARAKLTALYSKEKDPKLIGEILFALASVDDKYVNTLKKNINHRNEEIASGSILALMKYGPEKEKPELLELLKRKSLSSNENDRILAIKLFLKLEIPMQPEFLLRHFEDPRLEIQSLACQAALHDERSIPALIERLRIPYVRQAAFRTLVKADQMTFKFIRNHFFEYTLEQQTEFFNLLGHLNPDAEIINFLTTFLKQAHTAEKKMLHAVLKSLKNQSYKNNEKDEQPYDAILNLLTNESKYIATLSELSVFTASLDIKLLNEMIFRERELSYERIFLLLTFIYSTDSILAAMEGFATGDPNVCSYSIELLLQVLKPSVVNLIAEALYPIYGKSGAKTLFPENGFRKILEISQKSYLSFLASATLFTIRGTDFKGREEIIAKCLTAIKDPLIDEVSINL